MRPGFKGNDDGAAMCYRLAAELSDRILSLCDYVTPNESEYCQMVTTVTRVGKSIYDADFWKLREVALTFSLPTDWYERLPIGADALSLTVAGRNLALLHEALAVPNERIRPILPLP